MLRIMLELSQWEREIIGERTAAVLQQKKTRRERLGTTPLGYRTNEKTKQVTIDDVEIFQHLIDIVERKHILGFDEFARNFLSADTNARSSLNLSAKY